MYTGTIFAECLNYLKISVSDLTLSEQNFGKISPSLQLDTELRI